MFQHSLSPPWRLGGLALAGVAAVVSVGYLILAIGTSLGLQGSDTEGIDSGHGGTVNEDTGFALPDELQTSSAMNPGTSEGEPFDLSGQAIGIPPLTATDSQLGGGQAAGVGFAIPSNPGTTSRPGSSIRDGSPTPIAPTWPSRSDE